MLSNSKSKDGSLKDVHAEYGKYILGNNKEFNIKSIKHKNIKKLVFSETKVYVITLIIIYKCSATSS